MNGLPEEMFVNFKNLMLQKRLYIDNRKVKCTEELQEDLVVMTEEKRKTYKKWLSEGVTG